MILLLQAACHNVEVFWVCFFSPCIGKKFLFNLSFLLAKLYSDYIRFETFCAVVEYITCFFLIHQVLPVSYVRFSTSPVLYTHTRESLKALPLGTLLTFTVHFHAPTGETLHSSNSRLTFSTNRSVTTQVSRLLSLFYSWL